MKNNFRYSSKSNVQSAVFNFILITERALKPCLFALLLSISLLAVNGCRKDSSNEPLLQGNQAFHASAVAGYQTLGAGVSYPFKIVQLTSPTASPIHGLLLSDNPLHAPGSVVFKSDPAGTDSIEFIPYLNLYGKHIINGNILLMSFYSDAEGAQPAGNITVTLPTPITNPSDPTSYATYPANVKADLNITGGNLPCKGNLVISFTGGTGANTMTGTNTLTRDNVVFTLNLALDNQMSATGSITINESGATIEATNVQGQVFADLSCNITISPYGWTGTGVLNLITGSVVANVNTGTGISTATSDNTGRLNIKYADGTQEIVVNALSASLTGSGTQTGTPASITATSGTPQSAAINTSFASPLVATVTDKNGNPVSGVTVTFASPQSGPGGTFTGGTTTKTATTNAAGQAQLSITANATAGNYNVTASVAGVTTAAIFALTNTNGSSSSGYNEPLFYTSSQRTIVTINNNGNSIGYLPPAAGSAYNVPVYWSTLSSQPQTLQKSAGDSAAIARALNDNGKIVGYTVGKYYVTPEYYNTSKPLYWSGPTAQPQILKVPKNTYNAYALSINNSGQIVGYALSGSNGIVPLFWPSPSDTARVLAGSSASVPGFITSSSQIMSGQPIESLSTQVTMVVWASPTAQPVALKSLTGSTYAYPFSMNASGVIVGASTNTTGQIPVIWSNATASPQALSLPLGQSMPGSYYASSINTAGIIVGSVGNGYGGGDCTIWQNGQVKDLAVLLNNYALGPAQLITDQGWILGSAYYGNNQYVLIPR